MKKQYRRAIYIVIIGLYITGMVALNPDLIRSTKPISNWDSDLEGWTTRDPYNIAIISFSSSEYKSGSGSMKVEYDWRDSIEGENWFVIHKTFEDGLKSGFYNSIQISVKGDLSMSVFRIMIRDDDEWWVTSNGGNDLYILDFEGWKVFTIKFSDLKNDKLSPTGNSKFNKNEIKEIGINFWYSTPMRGIVYFDELQFVKTI